MKEKIKKKVLEEIKKEYKIPKEEPFFLKPEIEQTINLAIKETSKQYEKKIKELEKATTKLIKETTMLRDTILHKNIILDDKRDGISQLKKQNNDLLDKVDLLKEDLKEIDNLKKQLKDQPKQIKSEIDNRMNYHCKNCGNRTLFDKEFWKKWIPKDKVNDK